MKKINLAIVTILMTILLLGCKKNEKLVLQNNIDVDEYYNETSAEFVHDLAIEGMVLLKNDNEVLPLSNKDNVVLLGDGVRDYQAGGGGSGWVNSEYVIPPLVGMISKENQGKIELNEAIKSLHLRGAEITNEAITQSATNSNAAVIFITRNSEETTDRTADKGDYYLSNKEEELIKLSKSLFDKVIVVLNISGVMDTNFASVSETSVDGLLISWVAGQEGGDAIASVLVGDKSPTGKLATTFVNDYNNYLSSKEFNKNSHENYEEDIFVGYRQFETFDPSYSQVNYEFGFGLTYSKFDITNKKVQFKDNEFIVTADIKNTGNFNAKEVMQVYYSAPKGLIDQPAKELAGFVKTKLLKPGEKESVIVRFKLNDMASYDDLGKIEKSAWLLEKGIYKIYAGNSIKDASTYGTIYEHNLSDNIIVEKLSTQMTPIQLVRRIKSDLTYEELKIDKIHDIKKDEQTTILTKDFTKAFETISLQNYYNHTGSGTAVAFFSTLGAFLEFEIDVEEASDYNIRFKMANGGTDAFDVIDIKVNNNLVNNLNFDIHKTGDGANSNEWHFYEYTNTQKISLPKGKSTLRIESKGGRAPNISEVQLSPSNITLKDDVISVEQNNNLDALKPFTINFKDVYKNKDLMDDFIDQLTIEQLIALSGNPEGSQTIQSSTGVIGGSLGNLTIPQAESADGPAGIRLESKGVYYPSSTLLASTWNLELATEFGIRIGLEAKSKGISIWLAPGMNIQRNPLGGRNFEYYSEDPLVTGLFAKSVVNGVQSTGVYATIKHFAANNKEQNRFNSDSRISERALREIYLKGFEIVIKETDVSFVMTSYNLINGIKTAEDYSLINNILREEWGFDGVVMSDWWNSSVHVNELKSSANIKSWNPNSNEVLNAYKQGVITRENLHDNAKVILNAIMKTNAFGEINSIYDFGINTIKSDSYVFNENNEITYFIYTLETATYQIDVSNMKELKINGEVIDVLNEQFTDIELLSGKGIITIEFLDGNLKDVTITPYK